MRFIRRVNQQVQNYKTLYRALIFSMTSTEYSHYETSAKLIVQNLLISSYFCTFIV